MVTDNLKPLSKIVRLENSTCTEMVVNLLILLATISVIPVKIVERVSKKKIDGIGPGAILLRNSEARLFNFAGKNSV